MSCRKLVVGLGNPGESYCHTPHNLGFEVVDRLAPDIQGSWRKLDGAGLVAEGHWKETDLLLLKPLSYMNLSGVAVARTLEYLSESVGNLLVVCDDLALPWGKIRIRLKGGAGGHNGLKSVIQWLGTDEFARLRLGIAPGAAVCESAEYVLSPISPESQPVAIEMISLAVESVKTICQFGLVVAMNRFN